MAILFSNCHLNVFVIDIPRSLELANSGGRIFSAKAPSIPYVTPEPKGKKRDAFISTLPADHINYHKILQQDIQRAAQILISSRTSQEWCLPRLQSSKIEEVQSCIAVDVSADQQHVLPLILSSLQNDFPSQESLFCEIVLNPNMGPTQIQCSSRTSILVPEMCAFLWSSIEQAVSILQRYVLATDLQFDMILMDPPWDNRSVRQSSKYVTAEAQVSDPFDHALTLVAKYRRPYGSVAIWITNKASIHQKVLRSMAALDFALVEEWVWIKVTCKGEPTTPLNGIWRRPYEILLIFCHGNPSHAASRRYIFAVPDEHSRKPNLKELFSKLLQPASVLELFARNMTSGWWCIGNEVLKYQQKTAWSTWPQQLNSQIFSAG